MRIVRRRHGEHVPVQQLRSQRPGDHVARALRHRSGGTRLGHDARRDLRPYRLRRRVQRSWIAAAGEQRTVRRQPCAHEHHGHRPDPRSVLQPHRVLVGAANGSRPLVPQDPHHRPGLQPVAVGVGRERREHVPADPRGQFAHRSLHRPRRPGRRDHAVGGAAELRLRHLRAALPRQRHDRGRLAERRRRADDVQRGSGSPLCGARRLRWRDRRLGGSQERRVRHGRLRAAHIRGDGTIATGWPTAASGASRSPTH